MRPLAQLTDLHPQKLYCFVSGPGEGEAIALRIPNFGWILVDSYLEGDRPASLFWVERFPGPVRLLVWTHPHRDHCQGLDRLIERGRPERILVPGFRLASFPQFLASTRERKKAGASTKEYLLCQDSLSAYARVEALAPDQVLDPPVGKILDFPSGQIELCHPDDPAREELNRLMQSSGGNFFNKFSAVARIRWHEVELLLGADLETAGWNRVLAQRPDLKDVPHLKIPHHGSEDSFADWCLASNLNMSRTWWITPKNTSHLPQLEELNRLAAAQPELSLTTLPGYLQRPVTPGPVSLSALTTAPMKMGGIRRSRGCPTPANCCWAAQYAQKGLEETYFGLHSYLIRQD